MGTHIYTNVHIYACTHKALRWKMRSMHDHNPELDCAFKVRKIPETLEMGDRKAVWLLAAGPPCVPTVKQGLKELISKCFYF